MSLSTADCRLLSPLCLVNLGENVIVERNNEPIVIV